MDVETSTSTGQSVSDRINNGIAAAVRHWPLFVLGAVALYVGVAFSAPLFMMAGWEAPARLIYFLYRATCHQLPQRSFFLDGPQVAYSFDQISAVTGVQDRLALFWHPIYDATLGLGYQVAFCERDTAIYLSILATGLLFVLTGRRWKPLPWYGLALFALPIAIDGLSQLPGWRESTPLLRVMTGAIFGVGVTWFAFPHLERAMRDIAATMPGGAPRQP